MTSLNPTQRDRVLEYLNQREEMEKLPNLRTKTLNRIILDDLPSDLRSIIQIRLDAARASVKKLNAMQINTSPDGRARGLFVYYGAHTGRASAKRVQPHNFIRGSATATREMFTFLTGQWWEQGVDNHGIPTWISAGDLCMGTPLRTLAESMRGFIQAPENTTIVSGDYAQIEARVLAWLACCEPLLTSFKTGEDTYVRFAADHMYRRDYADYFDGNGTLKKFLTDERQRAKSAVLGAGFGLGGRGFREYCDNMNIIMSEEEADEVIKIYRAAYPEISDYQSGLWARVNWCAIKACAEEGEEITLFGTEVKFVVHRLDFARWWLRIILPSGRHIAYYRPKIDTVNKWGQTVLSFRTEWMGKSYREDTYGGRITENIVQGIARDICMIGAINADEAGYDVFGTVHDEILATATNMDNMIPMRDCLLNQPAWTMGLPLDAEIKTMNRYSK
jgi:DNA polymerase